MKEGDRCNSYSLLIHLKKTLNLLQAVHTTFLDVLETDEGLSKSDAGQYLQTESKEWGSLVDVTGSVFDRASVYIAQSCDTNENKVASYIALQTCTGYKHSQGHIFH